MFPQTLLCNEVKQDRCFAVDLILQERQQDQEQTVRNPHKVHLNRANSSLRDLIHWNWEDKKVTVLEPVLARELSAEALICFKETPIAVEKYPAPWRGWHTGC